MLKYFVSKLDNRVINHEESPCTIQRGCQITSGEGDFKASATEIYRLERGKGGKAR